MKFMQIKPQKARGVLKESYWTDPEWVAEEKFDGDRRIAQFQCIGEYGEVRFTGTRESVDGSGYVEKSANLPHLRAFPKCLEGTVLDGEIVVPAGVKTKGGKSKYVTSIMGSSPEEAIRKQKQHGWLEYMVFDCLWYKGKDLQREPWTTRRQAVENIVGQWGNPYAKQVPAFCTPNFKSKKDCFERILEEGGEGVILKNINHTYGNEKLWVKVKGEWTADVVIMGFEPGKGKYRGQVGAILFGQYVRGKQRCLMSCGTCSGFDDSLRIQMSSGPLDIWLGKVIEIKHNGREPTGAFRHPRFKQFRPDKSQKDCVYREEEI